jgi:allantoinase
MNNAAGQPTRDLIGYGEHPPHPKWPGKARVAVQFVMNYEEGAERSVLEGDPHAEIFLSEIAGAPPHAARHMSMESLYEYGSRAGVWRVLRLFRDRGLKLTVFGVAQALARNPAVTEAILRDGHEIAGHGWRWLDYQDVPEAVEREHLALAVKTIEGLTGEKLLGWYTGRDSPNTRRLVVEHGGFLYDSDSYADDLPYWERVGTAPHLIVPYTLDTNDMRFSSPTGFPSGEQFYTHLRDAFDCLYAEGADQPKMLSIGLHCRLVGRPARLPALARFIDHVLAHPDVWVARRIDIARHWAATHPASLPA